MKLLRHRLFLPALVAVAVAVVVALFVLSEAQAQGEPKSEADWPHDQYVTQLQAAQAENARMRETRVWNVAAILALCGAAASFARNTRAIQAVVDDLRRHSTIHTVLQTSIDGHDSDIAELTTEVRAGFATAHADNKGLHADIEGLKRSVDDLARADRMSSSQGSMDELARLLREGITSAKQDPTA